MHLSDLIHKPVDINVSEINYKNSRRYNNGNFMQVLFETAVPVVVFQFDGTSVKVEQEVVVSTGDQNQDLTQAMINKSIEKVANAAYFDRLNSWLGQIIQRDCNNVSTKCRVLFSKTPKVLFIMRIKRNINQSKERIILNQTDLNSMHKMHILMRFLGRLDM